jgi:opacity protein-like surface antigen
VKAQWETNWLIGLSGGVTEHQGILDLNAFHPSGAISNVILDVVDVGLVGSVFTGYQARCKHWLLGAEFKIDWQDLGNDHNAAFTTALDQGALLTARYRQNWVVALSGRFGYEVYEQVLPYVRLGVQSSRDKLDVLVSVPSAAVGVEVNDQHRVYRLLTGIGVEVPIPMLMGLSFRMEYNYLPKGGTLAGQALATDLVTIVTASIRPKAHTGLISFVFNLV